MAVDVLCSGSKLACEVGGGGVGFGMAWQGGGSSLLRPVDLCSSSRREQSSNGGGNGRARSTAELLTMVTGGVDGVAASPHLREQQWPVGNSNASQVSTFVQQGRCSGGGWRCILLRYGAKVAATARVFSFRWAAMATTSNHSRPPSSPPSSFPGVPLEPIHDGASFFAWEAAEGSRN
nr:hypothetical protein Iba_chr13eCG7920 [Ipomoea batatas]